ncbi:chemotaxis protein CheW [Acetobacterium woodii]|uniref:Chemotaxis protein CheW n=1 Tax=Acetobacterium woodii (strain ATCC 29683 / DSM 1030 / JCM 2381 / KCTC 1655 / WB1) TaxID=931626 RepID=H6LG11_ACEWD|nr:chemotaxis protein CheW [Acetobacterium woodii]AFA48299.1 chemotaxis protein CheW1 [Acetobacterium woodii DSM 1030]
MSDEFEEIELDEEDETEEDKFLTFALGNESYALEIIYVAEIIGIQKITEVPELPEYVKGIISLRGQIIPVVDVRLRFKKAPRDYDERTCIIVVDLANMPVGLIVDSVSEVIRIPAEAIVPHPELDQSYSRQFVRGMGKVGTEVKLLIDCHKLLEDDEMEKLDQEEA